MHSRGCAAFGIHVQLIVTDGLAPAHVGAKFEEDPQAGTEMPEPDDSAQREMSTRLSPPDIKPLLPTIDKKSESKKPKTTIAAFR
ncbi:hypothetical protein A2935_03935 [Candidatus Wolfebacteria bacterium RIFCSPLOWO2_01_FULL_47_17b]|uniref:Uncharacterized protein n=1 Tax=Candidatus Wolfebacteria bacterium RIFCSPLOWO2_01_FULL_47_17b TaxID=1802558 RepID=A0A1F8DWW0_9BACT|nr:MAG: hypothetical protein A2935_03935 [Candidatus Wolfebacteria bacterium RIFCSPLOWO2_01_FULL_47_17b]